MLVFLKKVSKGLRLYIESQEFEYCVLVEPGMATRPNDQEVSFDNYEEILAATKQLNPSAVVTDYEHYIVLASQLNEELGLPGLPPEAARRCTDKNRMRKAFHAHDASITPDFMLVLKEDDLERFAAEHDFPIMLKPTNMVKSLFITKNHNINELRQNYRDLKADLPRVARELGADPDQDVIIEEYLTGTMHTVAGFADSEGTAHLIPDIVDIETGKDRGSKENYLYSRMLPSILSAENQRRILDVAKKGIAALGMKNSAAHIEVMLTPDGPKLIEIGARPGGYRPRMYAEALDIDFYGAFLSATQGAMIDISSSKHHATCTIEVFPESRGLVSEITNKKSLEDLSSLFYLSYRIKEGEEAGLPSQGFKSAVIITLAHENQQILLSDKKFIDEQVRVII